MPVTAVSSMRAVWKIGPRGQAQILFIDDSSSSVPARRWPDVAMPGCRAGHIAFDPYDYPSLPAARVMVPEYAALWDAVAVDVAAVRAPGGASARAHTEFFGLPSKVKRP